MAKLMTVDESKALPEASLFGFRETTLENGMKVSVPYVCGKIEVAFLEDDDIQFWEEGGYTFERVNVDGVLSKAKVL